MYDIFYVGFWGELRAGLRRYAGVCQCMEIYEKYGKLCCVVQQIGDCIMKKKMLTVISAGLCAAVGLCGCSSNENEDPFTGDVAEELPYQAKLNAINPSAYSSVEGLNLEPGTYISVLGKEEDSPYWNQIRAGVQQAADDLNEMLDYSGDDSIKVLFNAPSSGEDIDEQVNILDEELARYPDVIAIASVDENASAVQFDLATENGIPIVAFDSDNTYQGIQCICITDNTAAAAEGAQKLCEATGGAGEVALIVHDSVSGNAKERAQAFTSEISENYPQINVVETIYMDQLDSLKEQAAAEQLEITPEQLEAARAAVAAESQDPANAADGDGGTSPDSSDSGDAGAGEEGGEETDTADNANEIMNQVTSTAQAMSDEDAVAYCLGKHPDLKGCFGTNEDAVQLSVSALENAEMIDNVQVMGFDAGNGQIEDLENGSIDGLIVQNPFGMGYAAVVAAARTVLESGNEAVVDTGYIWVDRDNLEEDSVQAMLYE